MESLGWFPYFCNVCHKKNYSNNANTTTFKFNLKLKFKLSINDQSQSLEMLIKAVFLAKLLTLNDFLIINYFTIEN